MPPEEIFWDYCPVTMHSWVCTMPRMSLVWKSTVEILVMPPFLAAVWMLASTPKAKKCRMVVPLAVPTFLPTGLLVAATGRVMLQLESRAAGAMAAAARVIFSAFILLLFR